MENEIDKKCLFKVELNKFFTLLSAGSCRNIYLLNIFEKVVGITSRVDS